MLSRLLAFFITTLYMVLNTHSQQNITRNIRIDHVLIAVNNLDSAKAEYEKNGFTVVYGGPQKKAFNALIFLQDGTAIELIGKDRLPWLYSILNKLRFTRLFGIMKDRIAAFRDLPEGLFNYCLHSEDLSSTHEYLKRNGLIVAKQISLSRLRDDNVLIKWELVGLSPYDLPFFIGDYSPSRMSDPLYATHANTAMALDSIVISTDSFEKYHGAYNLIYDQRPEVELNVGYRKVTYKLMEQSIILQETKTIQSFFKRSDGSAPIKFFITCDRVLDVNTLPDFISLTN